MILDKNTLPAFLRETNAYASMNNSLSQFYSNIGLEIDPGEKEIGKFWLHYNRFSRVLWKKTAILPAAVNEEKSAPWRVVFGEDEAELAFYGTDAFLLGMKGEAETPLLSEPDGMLGEVWPIRKAGKQVLLCGYSKNGDARDPDEEVPFLLGVRAVKGKLSYKKGRLAALPAEGELLLAFAFEALETDEARVMKKLASAPASVKAAGEMTLAEIGKCASSLSICVEGEAAKMAARAVGGLISNLALAPGRLKGHIASYPSRGYSSHFLWDTCFQNLAYEEMNVGLAKECLMQNISAQRADGKYEQFLCSTWGRPQYTQPSLIGWAAMRAYKKAPDKAFAKAVYESITANNLWWLRNRITPSGLIACPHGLETGQDDSPRFDDGPTIACDMNAYLLSQLNAAGFFAEELGKTREAEKARKLAKQFSDKMIKVLYDEKDNLFYDRRVKDGSPVKILSPVSFLPLWAGIDFPEDKAREMIEKYLLAPEKLFGDVPFPSVAYGEASYKSDGWWRGPTWMPEAWLMLETLEKFGYEKERREAMERFFAMLVRDGEMHEHFDSASGRGLGDTEQGWTCAIFLKLAALLGRKENA